ncbi:MAG: hypothetical protein B6U95_04870 [Thermofilum sp. ex4484_82]|nr:MAG: hypothetical protein B6U95_04870 [Thermofilum sp. ex4484_82]OYT38247.1 MAG: hypothetical protein B6U96_04865 [Archaeoglobales archaeon ex4484_92]
MPEKEVERWYTDNLRRRRPIVKKIAPRDKKDITNIIKQFLSSVTWADGVLMFSNKIIPVRKSSYEKDQWYTKILEHGGWRRQTLPIEFSSYWLYVNGNFYPAKRIRSTKKGYTIFTLGSGKEEKIITDCKLCGNRHEIILVGKLKSGDVVIYCPSKKQFFIDSKSHLGKGKFLFAKKAMEELIEYMKEHISRGGRKLAEATKNVGKFEYYVILTPFSVGFGYWDSGDVELFREAVGKIVEELRKRRFRGCISVEEFCAETLSAQYVKFDGKRFFKMTDAETIKVAKIFVENIWKRNIFFSKEDISSTFDLETWRLNFLDAYKNVRVKNIGEIKPYPEQNVYVIEL